MFDPIGFMAVVLIFGSGAYAIKRSFDLREKRLEGGGASKKELAELKRDKKLLQERVENLETIVCSVDYDLNLRLAKVAAEHSQIAALPAGEAAGAAAEPAKTAEEPATAPTLTAAGVGVSELARKAAAVREAASPVAFAEGQVIGNRYRVERPLGRGGMGAVYLAFDEVLDEEVALKVISSLWSHDPRALIERFRREVSAARKISSPQVIRIHDLGETRDGMLYISMEYVAGQTLAEILAAKSKLNKRETRDIIGQVCDGLGAAHEAGVIHRDLKPQNVLVGAKNEVKLIDFGLAKTAVMSGMTATGLMLGTPHYMSPEQVRGKEVDARSDIYSLGALTYHAVTGRPPFDADNVIAVGFAHCSEAPLSPREINPKVSKELDEMILEALAKDPDDRPQRAAVFREAL